MDRFTIPFITSYMGVYSVMVVCVRFHVFTVFPFTKKQWLDTKEKKNNRRNTPELPNLLAWFIGQIWPAIIQIGSRASLLAARRRSCKYTATLSLIWSNSSPSRRPCFAFCCDLWITTGKLQHRGHRTGCSCADMPVRHLSCTASEMESTVQRNMEYWRPSSGSQAARNPKRCLYLLDSTVFGSACMAYKNG